MNFQGHHVTLLRAPAARCQQDAACDDTQAKPSQSTSQASTSYRESTERDESESCNICRKACIARFRPHQPALFYRLSATAIFRGPALHSSIVAGNNSRGIMLSLLFLSYGMLSVIHSHTGKNRAGLCRDCKNQYSRLGRPCSMFLYEAVTTCLYSVV